MERLYEGETQLGFYLIHKEFIFLIRNVNVYVCTYVCKLETGFRDQLN